MLTVNLIPKNSPNALTFVFKAFKEADSVYKKALSAFASGEIIEIEDDFGAKSAILMAEMGAVTFSEYEKDMDKNGDLQIIQHKSQLKTQSKAKNDIGLQMLDRSLHTVSQ